MYFLSFNFILPPITHRNDSRALACALGAAFRRFMIKIWTSKIAKYYCVMMAWSGLKLLHYGKSMDWKNWFPITVELLLCLSPSFLFFFCRHRHAKKKREKLLINLKCQTCASDYLHFTDKGKRRETKQESFMKQHVEKREANGKNMFLPLLTFRMKNEPRGGKKIKRKLLSRIIIVCRKLKKK